jgi:hypothetical protein
MTNKDAIIKLAIEGMRSIISGAEKSLVITFLAFIWVFFATTKDFVNDNIIGGIIGCITIIVLLFSALIDIRAIRIAKKCIPELEKQYDDPQI